MDSSAKFLIRNRGRIISIFKLCYVTVLTVLFFGGRAVFLRTDQVASFSQLAINFGRLGLILYILTMIPGMARRFNMQHVLILILMTFRRHIGILVYLSVIVHFWLLRGIPIYLQKISITPELFEIMGTIAFVLLLPLFLTSNDASIKRLGIWWHRIHKLTYVVVGFVFFHVILQRVSIWSITIGIAFALQLVSFAVAALRKNLSKGTP